MFPGPQDDTPVTPHLAANTSAFVGELWSGFPNSLLGCASFAFMPLSSDLFFRVRRTLDKADDLRIQETLYFQLDCYARAGLWRGF
ncbi:MAG: hypothetical protein DMG88_03070 [Acidobacteria bacterium]|nr:MAG: hypothetical protein DMG88_03070 [Acidobacteriota bacterium]